MRGERRRPASDLGPRTSGGRAARVALLLVLAACGDPGVTELTTDRGELKETLRELARGKGCRLLERMSGDPGTPLLVVTCPGSAEAPAGTSAIRYRERLRTAGPEHPQLVGRNLYEVPAENLRAAEGVRLEASALRARLDVSPGRVLAREEAGDGPELVWEQELVGISKDLQAREARAGADPRFLEVQGRMRGWMSGFAQALYRVVP